MTGMYGSVSRNQGRLALWLALMGTTAGCGTPARPSPIPQAEPAPITTVAVQLDGRVLDLDTNTGIPGATVTLQSVSGVSNSGLDLRATTSNADGTYTLTVEVPVGWHSLYLDVDRGGYEPALGWVTPERVGDAVVRAYPTVTLQAGGTTDTQVSPMARFSTNNVCWFLIDEFACRRVRLDAAIGRRIDVEATSLDGSTAFGLVTSQQQPEFSGYQRQITVSTGEFWIVGVDSKIRLTARPQ